GCGVGSAHRAYLRMVWQRCWRYLLGVVWLSIAAVTLLPMAWSGVCMRIPSRHPLPLIIGLTVWAFWFTVLYGGLSVGCKVLAPDPAQGAVNWINIVLWLATLPVVGALAWAARYCARYTPDPAQPNRRFVARTSAGLYLLSAFATIVVAAPVWFLPPCV